MEIISTKEPNVAQELSEEERRADALAELGVDSFKKAMEGATLEQIRNSKMRAVAILSGGVVRRRIFKNEFKETLPSFKECDCDENDLITGGHLRIAAANILPKLLDQQCIFITTSGRTVLDGRTHAQIMAEHLEGLSSTNFGENKDKKFRIPYEQIIKEESSTKTLSNFIEIIGIAWQNGWDEIGIISNLYHFPRCKGFFRCLQEKALLDKFLKKETQDIYQTIAEAAKKTSEILGRELAIDDFFDFAKNLRVIFIGAEDVVKEYEKEKQIQRTEHSYTALLAKVEQSEPYYKRLKMEQNGYEDFLRGQYKTKAT